MHPILHFAVTLIVATYAYFQGNGLLTLLSMFFFGFLIDLDHFLTYWLANRKLSLNPVTVYQWNNQTFKKKGLDLNDYLFIFHEVEVILLVSAILAAAFKPLPLVAYLIHQGMDWVHRQIMNYNNLFVFKYVSRLNHRRVC